jgi:dolichol kinase
MFVFVDFFAHNRLLTFFSLKKKSLFVCSCYLPEFALNFFFVFFFFFWLLLLPPGRSLFFNREGKKEGRKGNKNQKQKQTIKL